MHTNTKKIIKILDQLAPEHLCESWDNVGLMVGYPNRMVENLMVTLEVTEAVIDEAIEKNIDMIISHHPLIYKPLKKLVEQDPIAHMVMRLLKHDINLYVAHTNLDAAFEGTSKHIANLLQLDRVEYVSKTLQDQHYKVQVFVPEDHAEKVTEAMTQAGAGQMGAYTECTFQSMGTGQFRPNSQASPAIGRIDELTQVKEVKVETIVSHSLLSDVLNKMIKAHPYEEPAYDVIELSNKFNEQGIGMYGYLSPSLTLSDLAKRVKGILSCDSVRYIGDANKKISRVAIITGSGADYFKEAKAVADVLITGDIKYHEAQEALQKNLMVIDAGHFETEQIYIERLKEILDQAFEEKSYDINVIVSETDINPFQTL